MPIVFTDAGQAHVVDVLDPATRGAQVTTYYGAWGSGSTAPAVGQTALVTENAESRVAATVSQPAANTLRFLWEVTATGNRTAREFGVFTASSTGTMVIRGTLNADTPIESGDRVEFTVDWLFKDVSE